jgi:hypothetical protein
MTNTERVRLHRHRKRMGQRPVIAGPAQDAPFVLCQHGAVDRAVTFHGRSDLLAGYDVPHAPGVVGGPGQERACLPVGSSTYPVRGLTQCNRENAIHLDRLVRLWIVGDSGTRRKRKELAGQAGRALDSA